MIRYQILLLAALVLPGAAMAQQRAVVVPAEASVIVPPRGAGPVPAGVAQKQPRLVSRQRLPAMAPAPPEVSPLLALLPLAAAAVLAATLGGGNGGGVSAPTSTTR